MSITRNHIVKYMYFIIWLSQQNNIFYTVNELLAIEVRGHLWLESEPNVNATVD